MAIRHFLKEHRHLRRLLIAGVTAVVVYTLAGFLLIPALARSMGQSKLGELLHRPVSIAEVRLNPYALTATVRGLRIREPDGARDLFSLKEIHVNLGIASLFKGGLVVQEIRVVEPVVDLVRTAEDRYNVSDIIESFNSGAPPATPAPASDGKPTRFSLGNIQLKGGQVRLDDRWKNTRHSVADINISVPFVSNFPHMIETFVQPAFSAVINGTRLAIEGRSKPFADSLESSIEVNLDKVDIPYYLAYLPVKLRMRLLSAFLDTQLKVTFVQYRDRPPRIDVGGKIALSALKIEDEQQRPLLSLPSLEIAIASSDLLSNKVSLRHVLLKSLALHIRRDRHGALQVQSLVAGPPVEAEPKATKPEVKAQGGKPASPGAAPPWRIEVESVRLEGARIAFADASNPQRFETTLDPLDVVVKNFTTAAGGRAEVSVSMATEAQERISLRGKLGVEPLTFDGTLEVKDLSLPRFSPYYASQILFDVRQGTLDLTVPARVAQKGKELDLAVDQLSVALRGLQLRRRGDREDFLRLPSLTVEGTSFDLGKRELVVGEVATADARIRLERASAQASWSLETLTPAAPPAAKLEPARKPAGAGGGGQSRDGFSVTLNKLDLKGWSVRIEDRAPRTPVTTSLDKIGVRVEGLSTVPGKSGKVSVKARLNQTGAIDVAGAFGISPLQANLKVQVQTLPLVPMQPYFLEDVGLLLTSGQVGVDGRLALATAAKGPVVTYKGEVSAGSIRAIARAGGEELAHVGELKVSGIDLVSEPFKADVGEVLLRDYGANLVINSDGTINLASLASAKGTAAPAPAAGKPATAQAAEGAPAAPAASGPSVLPVRLGALVLSEGNISVEDRSTRPAFATTLSHFGGRISGLALDETSRATVELDGKLGDGPLHISGRMNPLAKKPFIDLVFKLSDLDLSAMTPYSGKYAGYAIERGQLYLDLKYTIDARKLDASNSVKVAQLTFGQSVESKDATRLPVRLAVALLKDRHGVIDLDIPVSGSLDDPKFSIWGIVWTVVKNLLIKAATSPFALAASLFGGGEELAWLEFEPGRADITAQGKAKMQTLAKTLFERPSLRVEVEGHAAPTQDLEALRRMELQRRVRAEKIKETVAAGGTASGPVDVSAAEYPTYLKRAYQADSRISKPKNALGMLKDLPVVEMERLILGSIVVAQDDLRLLARQRARNARDEILRSKNIDTERVFLVEPKSVEPSRMDKVRDSRVDFRLQ